MNSTDTDLEAKVRDSLRAQAGRIERVAEPFDPTRPGLGMSAMAAPDEAIRIGRVRIAMAAAAAVALVVGSIAVLQRGPEAVQQDVAAEAGVDGTNPVEEAPTTVMSAPVPSDVAVPRAVPADLTLWSASFSSESEQGRAQLFGEASGAGARILVTVGGPGTGASMPQGGSELTVRGRAGVVMATKESADRVTTIAWQDDVAMTARFTGLDQARAVALLDSLEPRGPELAEGFVVPSGSDLTLLGESIPSGATSRRSSFRYQDSASAAPNRSVRADTFAATGQITTRYLETWLAGERSPDGTVSSYDPSFGTYQLVRTDGQAAWVDANRTNVSEAELRAVAQSIAVVAPEALVGLISSIDQRVMALPLLGAIDLPTATVEIHGTADSAGVCVISPTGPRCASPADERPDIASFLADGQWIVAAIGTEDFTIGTGPGVPAPGLDRGTAGAFEVRLLSVPSDTTQLLVGTATATRGVSRPSF